MADTKNSNFGNIQAGGNARIGDDTVNNHYTYIFNDQKVKIPVRLTNFIPIDDSHVVGREDELADTHQKLASGKTTVLVNGIGGIGKTTLALKYMVRYAPQYRHVAWLNAAAGISAAFLNDGALLDALQVRAEVEAAVNAAQMERAFDLVFKRLNDLAESNKTQLSPLGGGGTILVVLDNANDLADLLAYKKYFSTAHFHILLTSRANPVGWQVVPIESLPKDQAIKLFKNIYPSVHATDADLDTLLSELFYHTLLIELVAKAATVNAFDFERLRTAIHDKFIHDPVLQKRKVDVSTHSEAIGEQEKRAKIEEYILLIFKNVKDLPDPAKEMLRAFALLPPAMPLGEDFLTEHFELWDLTEDVLDILDISLVERGWLDKFLLNSTIVYSLHPLIAEVILDHLDVNVGYAEMYLQRVANNIFYNNIDINDNLFSKKEHEPFAERLVKLFFEENTEGVSELLYSLSNYNREFGFYQKAVDYGEKALFVSQNLPNKDEKTIAARQNNLANVYSDLGRYEQAAALLETAMASAEKNFGKDHPTLAVRQNNLAVVYYQTGRAAEAKVLWQQAYQIYRKNLGEEHPHTRQLKEYSEM